MNALIVSVDYDRELAVTLPRNAKHFQRVLVVTANGDGTSKTIAIARANNAWWYVTNSFYLNPPCFAKDAATLEGLRHLGPSGWAVLLDADILLPENMTMPDLEVGNLYAPRRRMCTGLDIPDDWTKCPLQKDIVFAGYFQLFHSADPNLQPWPNYPVEPKMWYADTVFQDRWAPERKMRLPFDVLHIGDPPGLNWCGRSPEGRQRLQAMRRDRRNFAWSSQWKRR